MILTKEILLLYKISNFEKIHEKMLNKKKTENLSQTECSFSVTFFPMCVICFSVFEKPAFYCPLKYNVTLVTTLQNK